MSALAPAPALRLRALNAAVPRSVGRYVLYWMVANRRTQANYALQHALYEAEQRGLPLVVLEALRLDYPHASPRFHRFVCDGMIDQRGAFAAAGIRYHPYVEPSVGAGRGLLAAWAAEAALVITDDWPGSFVPAMQRRAAARLDLPLIAVDSVGLVPLTASDREYTTAHSFRRSLHKLLPPLLGEWPLPAPLAGLRSPPPPVPPAGLLSAWPEADLDALVADPAALAALPLPRGVGPVALRGGSKAALARWTSFLADGIERYDTDRSEPDRAGGTGLSPYLHFGQISGQQMVADLMAQGGWTPARLGAPTGSRAGWWGLSAPVEALLDELVTWRELAQHSAARQPDWDRYETLPGWARLTLAEHAQDPRPNRYSPAELEAAATHDPLWNAAQRELVREGRLHNYMRMLWGKKVLEWCASPEEAFALLLHLNDKYALDGRDPSSVAGVSWVFGRFDRAWGPERPIFGKIRYMSSDNTARKLEVKAYLRRYGQQAPLLR